MVDNASLKDPSLRVMLHTYIGTITISAEEQANQNANIRLKLKGQDVPSGQKPFFQISRTRELMGGNLEKTAVYKSEVITKYQAPKAPVWAAFEVNISSLCQVSLEGMHLIDDRLDH